MSVIRAIHFPRGYSRDGLRNEVSLSNLARIVVLTGPNGSGKTRLLERISAVLTDPTTQSESDPEGASRLPRLEFATGVDPTRIKTMRLGGSISWPKPLGAYSGDELLGIVADFEKDMDLLPNLLGDALAILQSVTIQHLVLSHPDVQAASKPASGRINGWFARIKADLEKYAGASITVEGAGIPHVYGRQISDLRESDGQRKLIQYATALASIRQPAARQLFRVILLDEPEVHLHPGALIGLVDGLVAAIPNAQFFVATHSLPLIAHLGFHNTWFALNGRFQSAAAAPESAVLSLLGGEENIEKLRRSLDEPAHRAVAQFAAESLSTPKPVQYREGDPQCVQIIATVYDHVRSRDEGKRQLRILDYGAGRARLAAALSTTPASVPIDYHAYDPDIKTAEDCKANIALLHPGDVSTRYHSKPADLDSQARIQRFDIVIFCNVLHEIHPREWKYVIQEFIAAKILAEEGILLILEDLWMSHGELAYEEGFLLLDPGGMQELFAKPSIDELAHAFAQEPRYSDRLVAYAIRRNALQRMSSDTIRRTLVYTVEAVKEDIRRLRKEAPTSRNARRHAKSITQLANATLLLDSIR